MLKVEVGDRVKVVRRVDRQDGWSDRGYIWIDSMDKFIGNEYIVEMVVPSGIKFGDGTSAVFPTDAIELIEQKYIDGVNVSIEEFDRRTAEPVKVKEISVDEISKLLGYEVKVVK
jgi:hypothetical protein